ncbi:MAG: MFS transporter [Anaerolineae bacterium]|jgi:MFS family permease
MNRDTRLIGLALLLWGFGEGLFFHIQPLYIEELGATPVQIGGILSVANVVSAATYLPAGVLADLVPRKRVMAGGWITGFIGVLLVGLARSWQGLLPGLLIYAVSAYCIPVINAYLARATGGRNVARTFTTVFATYAAGGVLSPAVGGWLAGVTAMRVVYFVSASLFAISTLVVLQVSPQPVSERSREARRWRFLLTPRFLRLAAFTGLLFAAMYLAFPLAPNFLRDVGGWRVTHVGMLGSFQALGAALLSPYLGHLAEQRDSRDTEPSGMLGWAGGLIVGPGLVWASVLILLLVNRLPLLAAAYLLRGAYQGCRSLVQARVTGLASEGDRGLLLGATETLIAGAQVVAPYVAGWLYAGDAAYPFFASLVLIPIVLLFSIVGSRF